MRGLDVFFAGAREMFKAPLLVLAAPAIPLFLICLAVIGIMIVRELQKNKRETRHESEI